MNLTQICLQALAFLFIFPALGVPVYGGIGIAIVLAVCYSIALAVIVRLLVLSWVFTLGLSAVLTFFLFWLIPTAALYTLAWLLPQYIAIVSPVGAVLAGLVSLVIGKVSTSSN